MPAATPAKVMTGKAVLLAAAILGFVPVMITRDEIAAWIYVGSLIVIHVVAVSILVAKVRWHHLTEDKTRLVSRIAGLAVLAALAGLLKFDAESNLFWWSILGLWVLHVLALPLLHVYRRHEAQAQGEAQQR